MDRTFPSLIEEFLGIPRTSASTDAIREHGVDVVHGVEHNIYRFKNDDGSMKSLMFAFIIAPYSKADVKLGITGDNVLMLDFGGVPPCLAEYKNSMTTSGILDGERHFEYQLGEDINRNKVTAWASDGVLYVDIPYVEKKNEQTSYISIS